MRTKNWTVFLTRAITILCIASLASMMAYAQVLAGPNRPAGVPAGYVITPFGYFHPSCVHRLAAGDSFLGNGLVIQHADGTLIDIPACDYPRYTARGEKVAPGAKEPSIGHSWIVSGDALTGTSYGEVSATWAVPSTPPSNDGQIIYFFPGLEDANNVVSILQPVLGWNADYGSAWGIASWNCCPSGTTWESSPVSVNSGDQIFGDVKSTCAAGTLTCSTWNIISQDQTLSKTTTLSNTPNEGQTFNWAFAGVLEVYNVAQCSDYPPPDALTFNVTLYDNNFQVISNPGWFIHNWSTGLTPQCNYGGQTAPAEVTLTFGGPLATTTVYTGATSGDYGTVATLSAVLTDQIGGLGLLGKTLTFTLGSQHCTGVTNASGTASCALTLNQSPGLYPVNASFAGDSNYKASAATTGFTINKASTFLSYTGATTGDYNEPAILTAVLTSEAGTRLAGEVLTFTLGSQHCTGVTDAFGTASCTLTLSQIPGAYTVTASFAGDINYKASSASAAFTINKALTFLSYTGATTGDYHDPVTLTAVLTSEAGTGLPGMLVTFTLGSQTCTATTNASATASCGLTLNQASGPYTVVASFAGSSYYKPSNVSTAFTITKEQTTLSYTGDLTLYNGTKAHLSGKLLEDGVTPISGRTVTFMLGSGIYMQMCAGVTNALGVAACVINPVAQPRGAGMVADAFAGDAFYLPAGASATTYIYGFPDATRLSTKPNPSTVGQSVRLLAVVVPGPGTPKPPMPSIPIGTVTFYDLQTPLGTVTLDATATATLYVQFSNSGQHLITAQYGGDLFFVPSTATVSETVQ